MKLKQQLTHTVLLLAAIFYAQLSQAVEIQLQKLETSTLQQLETPLPDQLPMSRRASGSHDITTAWLAKPTSRYQHGVLGDQLEAAQLRIITRNGKTLNVELEQQRVFEDLQPRIVDLDGDNKDEVIVVESDENYGASLSVFGIKDNLLQRITATEFLGRPYRWLNPAGVGDFDGDGSLDIALVATPHIGGILRLYRYSSEGLSKFAEKRGVSTHSIGSTELNLAAVVRGKRDKLLLPDQNHTRLLLIEWVDGDWTELATIPLPAKIISSLVPVTKDSWEFSLSNGESYKVSVALGTGL